MVFRGKFPVGIKITTDSNTQYESRYLISSVLTHKLDKNLNNKIDKYDKYLLP